MYYAVVITFLVIFILTAILTLASLPDWIPISERYKKPLFTSLILEVIAAIFFIFKGGPPQSDVEPKVIHDTVYIDRPVDNPGGGRASLSSEPLRLQWSRGQQRFQVLADSQAVGYLTIAQLEEKGLFNTLRMDEQGMKRITLKPNRAGSWEVDDDRKLLDNFGLLVKSDARGSYYLIQQGANALFDLRDHSRSAFNEGSRITHLFPSSSSDHTFYLFRILSAVLTDTTTKHVQFLQLPLHLEIEDSKFR